MKVATMRLLDRALGLPACGALSALRRLLPDRPPRPVRRILFLKLAEQGTTVLARSAIAAAAGRVGAANVFFLVLEENREILDLLGAVPPGNVVAVPGGSAWSAAVGAARALRLLRRAAVDCVVDLEFFARSTAALAYLTGARTRVGLHPGPGAGPWRGDLLTHRVLHQPDLHTSQLFELLVEALDRRPDELPAMPAPPPPLRPLADPPFEPRPTDRERVATILAAAGAAPDQPFFLLNANAGDLEPLRRWPEDRYVDLARHLLDARPDASVLFTGSAAEASAAAALARRVASARCLSVAGRTRLADLLGLLALSAGFVTNDSGPGHFATLTSCRAVVLFGPESPRRFGPLSPRCRALHAGLACSPCLSAYNNRRSACRDNRCMQAITVEAVAEAIAGLPTA